MRLIELGELAYGPAKRQGAKQVRKRFLDTINPRVTEKILDAEEIRKMASDKSKFDFSELMELASKYQKKMLGVSSIHYSRPLAKPCDKVQNIQESEEGVSITDKVIYNKSSMSKVRCHFCNKMGHMQKDCWRKTKSCLICGKDHLMNQCPKYDPRYKSVSEDDATTLN